MKNILLAIVLTCTVKSNFGQCYSLFSFAAYFEQITFYNQSTTPNAHYYWNFGDGTSSYFENPTHIFPETGTYLVTLFTLDTVSNCSDYYEFWIPVSKYFADTCQPTITDSVYTFSGNYYISIIENAPGCSAYYSDADIGPAFNFPTHSPVSIDPAWGRDLFLSRVQYQTYDTISGITIHREAYKTSPVRYSSFPNYGPCSANFEFTVLEEDSTGQKILFKAMNKSAAYYQWEIVGFGSPVYSGNDTISQYYPYSNQYFSLIKLITNDASGCKDTVTQEILRSPLAKTFVSVDENEQQINFIAYPNPFSEQCIIELSKPAQNGSLKLFNTNGQIAFQQNGIYGQRIGFNRNHLPQGLYYFVVTSNGKAIATGKIIAN